MPKLQQCNPSRDRTQRQTISALERLFAFTRTGFPHSDIYGLTLARQLPVAYRSRAASFIASLESRHPPYALKFLIRKFIFVARLKTSRPYFVFARTLCEIIISHALLASRNKPLTPDSCLSTRIRIFV